MQCGGFSMLIQLYGSEICFAGKPSRFHFRFNGSRQSLCKEVIEAKMSLRADGLLQHIS